MRIFLLLSIGLSALLFAGELHLTLKSVSPDASEGTVETARVEPGVSGFVVHHFTPEHSAIVANAEAKAYDDEKRILTVAFSPYTGLRQNSLPKGDWQPQAGDELILAFAYSRALMLAPTRETYQELTSKIRSVDWIHPDTFATYLSYQGHPTPLKRDISGFCTVATTGLLFLYLDDALFTLDCQSFALLQITKTDLHYTHAALPFYSRVEEIDANWFGEGSDELESYEPYYYELMVENNPHSRKLYEYLQSRPSTDKRLLEQFELKEAP